MIRMRIPICDPEQRWPDKWLALLYPNAGDACLIIEIHDNVLLVIDAEGDFTDDPHHGFFPQRLKYLR